MVTPAVDIKITAADRTRQAFESASRRIANLTGGATRLDAVFAGIGTVAVGGGIAAAGAGLRALSRAVTQAVADLDALGKAAVRAGTDAEDLQGIRQFAERAGVATRAADVAMQRFTRRVGEAANGTGVLSKEFEALAIEVRDANGNIRPTIDVLGDYQRALQRAGSEAERSRLAFAAFDSEGVGFGLGLATSAESIAEFTARAREMGLIVSTETVAAAEALTDNMATLGDAIRASLTNALDPFIAGLADLTDKALTLRGLANAAVETRVAFGGLREAIALVGATGEDLVGKGLGASAAALVRLELELNNARNAVDELAGAEQVAKLEELNQLFLRAQQALADAGQGDSALYERIAAAAQAVRDRLKEARAEERARADEAERMAKAEKDAAEYAEFAAERQAASAKAYKASQAAAERLAEIEAERVARSVATLEGELLRVRQANELIGLADEQRIIQQYLNAAKRLGLRLARATTDEERALVVELLKEAEITYQKNLAQHRANAAAKEGGELAADTGEALEGQLDAMRGMGDVLAGLNEDARKWVGYMQAAAQLWQAFTGNAGQGGGLLGDLRTVFGGGAAQPAMRPPAAAGEAAAAPVELNAQVIVQAADLGANFRENALRYGDAVMAGLQGRLDAYLEGRA